jgi:RHS repeat-associated protein
MIENSSMYGLLTRYIHPNHQSSCTLETDTNGDIITYEEYHPFGTTSYQANNSTITAAAKRYRYTGMERDEETGLNYHNARYYIPWLGRWLNPDPIGIGDGVNVYGYCRNNPVSYTDLQGTQTDPKNTTWLSAGAKFSLTIGGGASFSLFAGGSSRSNAITTGGNVSATLFLGGPGTSTKSPTLFNIALSASITAGGGIGVETKLNLFNSQVGTGMRNNYMASFTTGATAIFSSGGKTETGNRNQIIGYAGFRAGGFTFGHANDVKNLRVLMPFGDGKDQFHSAITSAGFTLNNGMTFNYSNRMYYGKSNEDAVYSQDIKDSTGQNYDDQSPYNMELNNAQETLGIEFPTTMTGIGFPISLSFSRTGEDAMWQSNFYHDTQDIEDFTTGEVHKFHHLKVLEETHYVFEVQFN